MGKGYAALESDRQAVASARGEIDAMRARVRSMEDELLNALSLQLGELSLALSNLQGIGKILAELRELRTAK